MSWGRLDDRLHSHPKIAKLANRKDPITAWVRMISWSCDYGTHGAIPKNVALGFATPGALRKLVTGRLLEKRPDGFEVHDFAEYGPPSSKVSGPKDASKHASGDASDRMHKGDASDDASKHAQGDASGEGARVPSPRSEIARKAALARWNKAAQGSAPDSDDASKHAQGDACGHASDDASNHASPPRARTRASDPDPDPVPTTATTTRAREAWEGTRERRGRLSGVDPEALGTWCAELGASVDLPKTASLVPYVRRAMEKLGDVVTAKPETPLVHRLTFVSRTTVGLVNDDKQHGWASGKTDGAEGVCAPPSAPEQGPSPAKSGPRETFRERADRQLVSNALAQVDLGEEVANG